MLKRLHEEVKDQIETAQKRLYLEYEEDFGSVIKHVQQKRGAMYLVRKMKEYVEELYTQGELDEKEANVFVRGKISLSDWYNFWELFQ